LFNIQKTIALCKGEGSPSKEYGEAKDTLHDKSVLDCKDTFF